MHKFHRIGVLGVVLMASGLAQAQSSEYENKRREQVANEEFEQLMQQNTIPRPVLKSSRPIPSEGSGTVTVPLESYESLRNSVEDANRRRAQSEGPPVVLGGARYDGRVQSGVLSLRVDITATLSGEGRWKLVPLIGDTVVVVEARRGGQPISLSRQNGYHVWVTSLVGEVDLSLDVRVPAQGRRGSIEYDFNVVKTPTTSFVCRFSRSGLEPRLFSAVRSEVSAEGGGTLLRATLRPSARLTLVGFRDIDEESERPARIYAESLNLLSVDTEGLDLFSVIRYSILYAGTRTFTIRLPPDSKLVSAEGQGAFRYTVEPDPGGDLLRGETAFPIRDRYEISLRLRREITEDVADFEAFRPSPLEVERDSGFIGVEVTGKVKLEETSVDRATSLDMRQLPPEMLDSAVSPILRAYRYYGDDARIELRRTRLPEKEPESAAVDQVRAVTTVSNEGRVLTEMRIRLRNRLRHHLRLALQSDTEVRSTLLDGAPARPSRDQDGALILPLKRSGGDDTFTVQVTLQTEIDELGWWGTRSLTLPRIDLPVSVVEWTIYLPSRHRYSEIEGDIELQRRVGSGQWHRPSGEGFLNQAPVNQGTRASLVAENGAMPVRIAIPKTGRRVDFRRFWQNSDHATVVSFGFARGWLVGSLGFLLWLATLGFATLSADRRFGAPRVRIPRIELGSRWLALLTLVTSFGCVLWFGVSIWLATVVFGIASAAVFRWRAINSSIQGWFGDVLELRRQRKALRASGELPSTTVWLWLWRANLGVVTLILLFVLAMMTPELLSLVFRPLSG